MKHEYLGGQIYAMAGGTPEHAAIATAVAAKLFASLQGGRCRVYNSDLRVRVTETGLATYPDVSVICGPRAHDAADRNTVTNPVLLVEVTSRSTEEYDRGEKLDHYRRIPSLEEYVLISHTERAIEVRRRAGSGEWRSHVFRASESAQLESIGCALEVDAVHESASDPSA